MFSRVLTIYTVLCRNHFFPIADAKNALKKGFLMGSNIFKKQENVQSWAGTHLMI